MIKKALIYEDRFVLVKSVCVDGFIFQFGEDSREVSTHQSLASSSAEKPMRE